MIMHSVASITRSFGSRLCTTSTSINIKAPLHHHHHHQSFFKPSSIPIVRAPVSAFSIIRSGSRANMSTSTEPLKFEWLCVLPDQEDALPRRLEVRPKHLENMSSLASSGRIVFGGILLDHPIKPDETPVPFKGSALVLLASTKEEAIATLKADPYTSGNVWDWDKVLIYPFRTAIRAPAPSS